MDKRERPYTASELARTVGISAAYVCRLCRRGDIEAVKVGNAWIIQAEDAQRWIEERATKQEAQNADE
jgi:excisionase family DNA binding protein